MTWKRVILLALISAVITALLNCIPALERTSFTCPAETLELWIVLAIYIIMNSTGYKDAAVKTFVFFLISQPLIYLIEVPFKTQGWGLFSYYPFWGIFTVLTIPGAIIAYRVKKDDILAALILSVANAVMIFTGASRIGTLVFEFPRFLIAVLFCFAVPFALIFVLLKQKKSRMIALILAVLIAVAALWTQVISPADSQLSWGLGEEGWALDSVSDPGLEAYIDGEDIVLRSHKNGNYTVMLTDPSGTPQIYEVVVSGGNHYISVIEP